MSEKEVAQSWWVGKTREEFTSALPAETLRMRNTRLPQAVSAHLLANEFLEQAELMGEATARNPVVAAAEVETE